MKKLLIFANLCFLGHFSYSQDIPDSAIVHASERMSAGDSCCARLTEKIIQVVALKEKNEDLVKKLEQSKTLDKIRADFENQMVKKQLETEQLAETQRKKKVRWRNFGIGAIIKDLATIAVIIINPLKLIK